MKALLKKIEEHGMNAYVTFECALSEVPEIPKGWLEVSVKKYREPRSREALNYLWSLVTEIAELTGEDKDEVYVDCVCSYGILETDKDGDLIEIVLRQGIDPSDICGDGFYLHQTHYSVTEGNQKFYIYWKVKRPSEYNSSEFARFTDGVKRALDEINNSI